MIDTSYLSKVNAMSEQQFLEIAAASDKFALVNVIPINDSEWAIFGPYGVYVSQTGERAFPSLASAQEQLAKWRVRKFFQVGELKVFPETAA